MRAMGGAPELTADVDAFLLRYRKLLEGMKTLKGGDCLSEVSFESKGRDRVFEWNGPGKAPPCKSKESKQGKVVGGQANRSVSEAAEVICLQAR